MTYLFTYLALCILFGAYFYFDFKVKQVGKDEGQALAWSLYIIMTLAWPITFVLMTIAKAEGDFE